MGWYAEPKKVQVDKILELVYHGVDPSVLKDIPPEMEEYFWRELDYITAVKKMEQRAHGIETAYLGHLGTINRDPKNKKPPEAFFGSKIMSKELEGLARASNKIIGHLSHERKFTDIDLRVMSKEGYTGLKKGQFKRVETTLQNGQKLIRNEEII